MLITEHKTNEQFKRKPKKVIFHTQQSIQTLTKHESNNHTARKNKGKKKINRNIVCISFICFHLVIYNINIKAYTNVL